MVLCRGIIGNISHLEGNRDHRIKSLASDRKAVMNNLRLFELMEELGKARDYLQIQTKKQ